MKCPPMTIADLITTLNRKRQEEEVAFDFAHFRPDLNAIGSYRGYYDQLAIGYTNQGKHPTVAQLVLALDSCIGKTLHGYKGGAYTMHAHTPVWVAQPNEAAGTAIVDVETDIYVRLVTAYVE